MKTIKFFTIILLSFLLFSCETIENNKKESKNNGPTLESRICGTWNSAYYIPVDHINADLIKEKKGEKIIIDTIGNNIIYQQYNSETGELSCDYKGAFLKTTYKENLNIYTGIMCLCDSIKMSFVIKQDTLETLLESINDEDIIGQPIYGFIKELH